MRTKILKVIGAASVALGVVAMAPGTANAATAVDYSSLPTDVQAKIVTSMNTSAIDLGGQTFRVNGKNGPCFGIYVGRVTFDSSGRITKIETATVEFYEPVLSCLI